MSSMEIPIHLILDVLDFVYLDEDVDNLLNLRLLNRVLEIEITRYLARFRLQCLVGKFACCFTRYEIAIERPEYQFAKLYQFRLVLENVTLGSYEHKLRKFIHNVTDQVCSRFLDGTDLSITPRSQVLQNVCMIVYTHYSCRDLFYALAKEDFDHQNLLFPETDQHVLNSSIIVAIIYYYNQAKIAIEKDNLNMSFQTEHFGSPLEMAARLGYTQTLDWLLGRMDDRNNDQNLKLAALDAA